jgi:large subunit ribosomal protein L25
MSEATLTAEKRTDIGSRPAGRLRRQGLVPAVVYGLGNETVSVTVPGHDLSLILARGANTLITLRLDGEEQLALARQVQRHPVKGSLVHVDFIRVRADQAVQAEVPVHLEGTSEGVSMGGMLEQGLFAVSIEALPRDIPAALAVDIAPLQIGDGVHVRDLELPPGVTVLTDADELIAHVVAPRVAEAEAEEAAEGEAPEGEAAAAGGETEGTAGGEE